MEKHKVVKVLVDEESTASSLVLDLAFLKDYPRVTHRHYVINRREQRQHIWSNILGNKGVFTLDKKYRTEMIESVMFWLANIFQFIALVLSFSKDTSDSSEIFRLSIFELVFAVYGILIACFKQWRKWRNENKAREVESTSEKGREAFSGQSIHMGGFIISSNLVGCAMLICGFILLYMFDKSGCTFLRKMIYFTGLIVFILAIADNIIMNRMMEGENIIKQDQMRLLIHELKEELFEELQLCNKYERVKTLRDYIHKYELFKIQQKGYLFAG